MLHKNFSSEADENCTHNSKSLSILLHMCGGINNTNGSISTIDLKIKAKIFILKIPLTKGGYDQHAFTTAYQK